MTSSEFGRRLLAQIDQMGDCYDPAVIADWAEDIFFQCSRDATEETRRAMEKVICMAEGSEFEMSRDELRQYAYSLIDIE